MEHRARSDLISGLPDDILRRISCFVPLKGVMRTGVLSTRWRSLWTPTRLKFRINTDDGDKANFGRIRDKVKDSAQVLIRTFLGSYDVPDSLKLCFVGNAKSSHETPNVEDHMLMTIMSTKGGEKELHIQFTQNVKDAEHFHLKLEPGLGTSNLVLLRQLHLRSVSSLGSEFVSALFSTCHFLKVLSLDNCLGLETIAVTKNCSLQELAIWDCPALGYISICAMELKTFHYRGALANIELTSTSNLAEVALNLRDGPGPGEFDCEDVLSFLDSIKDIENLTVSGWLLEWLCWAGVIYKNLDFQFNRMKELRWIDASINQTKRDSLACFLNICPVLNKLFINVDNELTTIDRPFMQQYWHEPHLWRDYQAVKTDLSNMDSLKTVRMALGHLTSEEERLSLMELLLEKALVLESMSVMT